MALCGSCNALDFQSVGLYRSDFDDSKMFAADERKLNEVKTNAESCFFCRKVVEIFDDWVLPAFGSLRDSLDVDGARAGVGTYRLRSLETAQDEKDVAHLIMISVSYTLRNPDPDGPFLGGSVYFQKTVPQPTHVSEVLKNTSTLQWLDQEPYTARIRPLVADTRLFRKWKEFCAHTHGGHCENIYNGLKLSRIRLIDVHQKCIVEPPGEVSWVALSYVWGQVQMPTLQKDSIEHLRQPGSLTENFVPATIHDAMTVTAALGEKYLWTDSLCIIQDDDADLLEFIPRMDSIYGHASVTIIDAAGANACHGLSGIQPASRHHEQTVFEVKGVSLLQTLDPPGVGEGIGLLADAEWSKRGWTFQEGVLSGRSLIFTPEQVYWQCQNSTWCEDSFWECPDTPTIYRHSLDDEDFRQLWQPDAESFERKYRKVVGKYSERMLTYENDGLDAFTGILGVFERATGQSFLWGLPTLYFGVALTWPCEKIERMNVSRRTAMCKLRRHNGQVDLCPFPSWSWVGWVGRIIFDDLFGYLDSKNAGLVFYTLHEDDQPQPILQNTKFRPYRPYRLLYSKTDRQPPDYSWRDENRTDVTTAHVPKEIFSRRIHPTIICFWTSTATLEVHHDANDHAGTPVPQISRNGLVLNTSWPHKPRGSSEKVIEQVKFIVIGRESLEDVRGKNELSVLMVDEDHDGVLYRRGMAIVNESQWVALRQSRMEGCFPWIVCALERRL